MILPLAAAPSLVVLWVCFCFFARDKELVGTLRGFDDYVNMVLEDVIEYVILSLSLSLSLCVCVCFECVVFVLLIFLSSAPATAAGTK